MVTETIPVVLRIGPYTFLIFASDQKEPPHVHVRRDRHLAKLCLDPVRVERDGRFSSKELRRITTLATEHEAFLLAAWHDFLDA